MKLKRFLIAGGNSTLLVWGCPSSEKNKIIKKYLGEVEQIGFAGTKNKLPFLNMMGGELCVNGTIALASVCGKKGKLFTSGLQNPIFYRNVNRNTSINLNINYKKLNNKVLLEGIGYIYLKRKIKNPKKLLSDLCNQYNFPAFGILYSQNNKIQPVVYVKQTDSLFAETACGSGSIAFSILTGKRNIIQPTGKTIIINRINNSFTVSAKVTRGGKANDEL